MPSEVSAAYLSLRARSQLPADISAARGEAVAGVSSLASAVSSSMLAVPAAVGAGVAAGINALTSLFNQARSAVSGWVDAAAQAELAQAQFNRTLNAVGPIIGWTSEQLGEMTRQLTETTTFSARAAQGAEQMLMRFGNVRGDIFRDALAASADLAASIGQDLPQAAQRLGMALETPAHGLRMLREYGIVLDQQQQQLIHSTTDLAEQQRLLLQIIRDSGAVSGAAEARRNTFAGQREMLGNQWQSVTTSVGQALIPAFQAITPYTAALADSLKQVVPIIQEIGTALADVIGPMASMASGVIRWFVQLGPETRAWVTELGKAVAITGALTVALYGVWTAVTLIEATISGATLGAFVAIAAAVALVGVAVKRAFDTPEVFERIATAWDQIVDVATRVWEVLTTALKPAFESLGMTGAEAMNLLDGAIDLVVGAFEEIAKWVNDNKEEIAAWAQTAGDLISAAVQVIVAGWNWLKGAVQSVITYVKGLWSDYGEDIKAVWNEAVAKVKVGWDWVSNAVKVVIDYLQRMWDDYGDDIVKTIQTAIDFVVNVYKTVEDWLGQVFAYLESLWDEYGDTIKTVMDVVAGIIIAPIFGLIFVLRNLETVAGLGLDPRFKQPFQRQKVVWSGFSSRWQAEVGRESVPAAR
jgi:phage-related protein